MSEPVEVRQYFHGIVSALSSVEEREVWRVSERLQEVRERQASVWLVGNGGSAATAAHFANDLWKMCHIKAWALPGMVPIVTAYGNDEGWARMFSSVLDGMAGSGDLLIAISCGGASANVIYVADLMNPENLVVMTGPVGFKNELARMPCYAKLVVRSGDIRVVEDVHLAICHCIVGLLRDEG